MVKDSFVLMFVKLHGYDEVYTWYMILKFQKWRITSNALCATIEREKKLKSAY